MSFGGVLRQFGKTWYGFVVLLVFLAALSGFLVGALGVPIGGIFMLAVGFGIPIYLHWNQSLVKFLGVALAILLLGPLFTGFVITPEALAPSPAVASSDNVLQNGTVSPFESTASHPEFTFTVDAFPDEENRSIRLVEVYVWVTNCIDDTDKLRHQCQFTPPDFFSNQSVVLNATQQNVTGAVPLSFTFTNLPTGNIFYFTFFTAIASVDAASVLYYGLNEKVGGWSCTTVSGYSGCDPNEGPISTSYWGVYVLLLAADYLWMLVLVAVLSILIVGYMYFKRREKVRRAQAKAAAEGADAPKAEDIRCPHCQAVLDTGETTCWRCKKDISAPVEPKDKAASAPLASKGTTSPGPKADDAAPEGPDDETPATPGDDTD